MFSTITTMPPKKVAILHGAGYVGGELIRILLQHPQIKLVDVTSRTFAGKPVFTAHPELRGQTDMHFVADIADLDDVDALLIAAEHGRSCQVIPELLHAGFDGAIVDLSADFRHSKVALYDEWYGFEHPAPDLLDSFQYGLPEVFAPYASGTKYVANPGCFATALSLALWPLADKLQNATVNITALTGASGSGASPSSTTHYPTREGNVRAYKVLAHQHLPEVQHVVGPQPDLAFTPVSGPWTRGIWGTAQITLDDPLTSDDLKWHFSTAYGEAPLVRCWPDELPELRYAAKTPFCDIGWESDGKHVVVGFAIDNLLKGAASQAVQNLNLVLGLPETAALLPHAAEPQASTA